MFNVYPYLNVNDLNLDWIIKHFKEFIDEISSLNEWRTTHEKEYEELKNLLGQIADGELTPAMTESIKRWCEANLFDLVGNMIKFIAISLNDEGYIVVKFPSQWNNLIFNTTGLDINTPLMPEYGHLTLSY